MIKVKLFLSVLFTFFCSVSPLFAACEAGESELVIDIIPDAYPFEITWAVNHYLTGTTILTGNADGGTFCLPNDDCYDFTIYDLAGDGICCYENGLQGEYAVYFGGNLIIEGAEYTASEYSGSFGCPNGKACSSALTTQEGFYSTPFAETWYKFTPTESGLYKIATCYNNNSCNTAIWAYDYCAGLPYNDNLEAALKFSAGGCSINENLATTQINFVANQTYYIRIGNLDDCDSNIFWELEYLAPITDCTDAEACNYNPFAQISDNSLCEYAGGNNNCAGPDFTIDEEAIKNSLYIGDSPNDATGCFVNEGCLNGTGIREVLRFDTKISNVGNQDFYLGTPNEQSPLWVFDPCHMHYHFESYAEYILYDENNQPLPIGYKTGFCLEDSQCPNLGDYKFGCGTQGLTVGCADVYSADLNCQWIDITDVNPGLYSLVVRVNWAQSPDSLGRYEQDYNNNWAQVCFELFRDAEGEAFFEIKDDCGLFVDCTGEIYGDAIVDCSGECNGSAKYGDINANNIIETEDFDDLVAIALAGDQYYKCYDLSNDGNIDLYDLTLLNNCLNNNDACDFPMNISNFEANVEFSFQQEAISFTENELQEWAQVNIITSASRIGSFEIGIENATIENYELLIAPENAQVFIHPFNNRISVIYTDDFIPFINEASPLIRLQLSNIDTASDICLSTSAKAVSNQMHLLAPITNSACITPAVITNLNSIATISQFDIQYSNDFIKIENLENAAFSYAIYNIEGKQLFNETENTEKRILVSSKDLTTGIYVVEIKTKNNIIREKVVVL